MLHPPIRLRNVPFDSLSDSFLKLMMRFPTQFFHFSCLKCVTKIMSRPIGNERDQITVDHWVFIFYCCYSIDDQMKKIKIGDIAIDRITGFQGTVTAKTEWLNGCVRFCIQPKKLKENGSPVEAEWVDAEQVERVEKKARRVSNTGGPQPDPAGVTGRPDTGRAK